jgi:hypothetical protein
MGAVPGFCDEDHRRFIPANNFYLTERRREGELERKSRPYKIYPRGPGSKTFLFFLEFFGGKQNNVIYDAEI